jgi:hypothetical protein
MSAKKNKKSTAVLLIPGPQGWDVWEDGGGEAATLKVRTSELRALDVEGLPSRDLHMAFPVREVSALPLKSPATEAGLFRDMAEMHVERMGMRPQVEMGNLSDFFEVAVRKDECVLLPVVLSQPPEGTLPRKSPKSFDVSARCFPMPTDGVVVWRELGRWVFGVGLEGKPLYFQALAAPILGEAAGREIAMSLTQLQIQGLLESRPKHCFVWLTEEEIGPSKEQLDELGRSFGGTAAIAAKPTPEYPGRPSGLLPADTRAERVAKRKQQQVTAVVAALVVAYVGLAGWLGWKLVDKNKQARIREIAATDLEAGAGGLLEHAQKWNELDPITGTDHWPVELLFRCAQAIPEGGVRFKRAEFYNQLDMKDGQGKLVRSINIQGEAGALEQVNQFNLNLKRSNDLAPYEWTTPDARETNTGAWGFTYTAAYTGGATN